MAYTPPAGNAVNFDWTGKAAYTPPSWNPVNFSFAPSDATIDIAASVTVTAAQDMAHGIAADGVATVTITAAMSLEYTTVDIDIDIAASVQVLGAGDLAHGVAVDGIASIPVTADLAGVHGAAIAVVAGVPVQALVGGAHGTALDGIALVGVAAALDITVERYEVRGEVRLSGVLVNRRVRAYLRSSGVLLGETDTVVGKFHVPTGFAEAECYVTPIDLDDAATDWLPPTANRITSVLALDTA